METMKEMKQFIALRCVAIISISIVLLLVVLFFIFVENSQEAEKRSKIEIALETMPLDSYKITDFPEERGVNVLIKSKDPSCDDVFFSILKQGGYKCYYIPSEHYKKEIWLSLGFGLVNHPWMFDRSLSTAKAKELVTKLKELGVIFP